MKHLRMIVPAALATLGLALPALADDHGRGNGRGDRFEDRSSYSSSYRGDDYRNDRNYNRYGTYAPYAPPPVRVEAYGRAPGRDFVWVSGYWEWTRGRYAWVPGRWMRPPHRNARWVGAAYIGGPRGFGFRAGFWSR